MEIKVVSAVMGVLKHQKLMELKNSGVVNPNAYLKMCREYFEVNCSRKKDAFLVMPPFEKLKTLANGAVYKDFQHFMAVSAWGVRGENSSQFFLANWELEDLNFLQRAYRYALSAEKVIEGFRSFDELLVDSSTGKAVDWLLHNKVKLKDLLQKEG